MGLLGLLTQRNHMRGVRGGKRWQSAQERIPSPQGVTYKEKGGSRRRWSESETDDRDFARATGAISPAQMWFGYPTLFQRLFDGSRLSPESISDFPLLERRVVSGRPICGVKFS